MRLIRIMSPSLPRPTALTHVKPAPATHAYDGSIESRIAERTTTMFKHLFVPVDGSDLSTRAMEQSLVLAQSLGARVTGFVCEPSIPMSVVNANPTTFQKQIEQFESRTEAHAHKVLTQFAERAAAAGVVFDSQHRTTDATDAAIAEAADAVKADLIVMVTHGRGVFGEMLYGSHTKNVMSKTKVPLLVLH